MSLFVPITQLQQFVTPGQSCFISVLAYSSVSWYFEADPRFYIIKFLNISEYLCKR